MMRGLRAASTLVLLLAGCGPGGRFTDELFARHHVDLGAAARPTVLTGFFLGGEIAELATVHIDEGGARRLRLFAHDDGAWAPALEADLAADVTFVDVARIDGRDRVIASAPDGVSWFDPATRTTHLVATVASDFAPPDRGVVWRVDVTHDVNGDGLDDLVVPDGHGFQVLVQAERGSFADPVRIGPRSGHARVYGADAYRYDPWSSGRVHAMDHDRDGRRDLVHWNGDHFLVHRQAADGRFAATPERFETDVLFDSDEIATLAAPGGVRHRRRDRGVDGRMSGRVLHSLDDVNGDGVGDLVIFALHGGNRDTVLGDMGALWTMRSACEVHYGVPTADGRTAFGADVDAAVRSDGIPFGIELRDVDGDGRLDVMGAGIRLGLLRALGMIVEATLTGAAPHEVSFHRLDESDRYPDRPNAVRTIRTRIPGASGERAAFFPPVRLGDVTGDGRIDLLLGTHRDELRVHAGEPGRHLFARAPLRVRVTLPLDEEHTWLADLNRDGRDDLVMHRPSAAGPDRVTLLVTR